MMTAGAVHVAVGELFLRGFAHFGDFHIEVQLFASQRMVAQPSTVTMSPATRVTITRIAVAAVSLERHADLDVLDALEGATAALPGSVTSRASP